MDGYCDFDIVCKICNAEMKYSTWIEHKKSHNIINLSKKDDFQLFQPIKIYCIFCHCDVKHNYYKNHVETHKHIDNKMKDMDFNMEKQRLYNMKNFWGDSINYIFKHADKYFEKIQTIHNFDFYEDKINIYFCFLIIAHKFIDDMFYDNSTYIQMFRPELKSDFLYKVEIFCLKEIKYQLYLKNQ